MSDLTFNFTISKRKADNIAEWIEKHAVLLIVIATTAISILTWWYFYQNGLSLAYNDARSHLNIGRRVVEGLKPGFAQIGSVWLPLPHILMIPTIWSDFMWHTGLSGALQSMIAYVVTGVIIYKYLKYLGVYLGGRLVGVAVFALNLNILYLQSTAMTELLLLVTMSAGAYYLLKWHKSQQIFNLIAAAFWIMVSTLVRYDGWFLFGFAGLLVALQAWRMGRQSWSLRANEEMISLPTQIGDKKDNQQGFFSRYQLVEGMALIYASLAALGIGLWFLWNWLIFGDPFYFIFGPFSAHAQQQQIEAAGELITKHNWWLSIKTYLYALMYNSGALLTLMAFSGAVWLWLDKRLSSEVRWGSLALAAPLVFNILALYLGHSVLFVPGINGETWFNVRYGIMMLPSLAIFIGYLVHRMVNLRIIIMGVLIFMTVITFTSGDAVTIDDGRVGSSQKNVSEVSNWLKDNAADKEGLVLVSAASHDAIIFSSGMPMTRFIHEGTGDYWEAATTNPDLWARWIIMRTHDDNDLTFKLIKDTPGFELYELVDQYPFADIYQLKPEYVSELGTIPELASN